jgi:BNR repeat-like domain
MITEIEAAADGLIRRTAGDPDRFDAFIPSPCVQNHAANLMPLANGDLGCVWFGGTQEGMADISVYFSRLASGSTQWSPAEKLSDDPTRSEQNPILFPAPDGMLWLMWTAQISGNQDTAFVRRRLSRDNGRSWGPIETLFSAQKGHGTFIRQPIVVLDNGDWLLPVFYCRSLPGRKWNGDDDTSAVKISSDSGKTWTDVDVPGSHGCVHMCIDQLADGTLLARAAPPITAVPGRRRRQRSFRTTIPPSSSRDWRTAILRSSSTTAVLLTPASVVSRSTTRSRTICHRWWPATRRTGRGAPPSGARRGRR